MRDVTTASAAVPYPPFGLRQRVGPDGATEEEDVAFYEIIGKRCADHIARILPEDWTWEGKRILDFGCGAGRTIRHFLDRPESTELFGCDLHGDSIRWMEANLPSRLQVFENGLHPPLDVPAGRFDLVYALSVFTHINEDWAGWLLEMQRILAPGGLLLATFLGPAMWDWLAGQQLEEDEVGMISCKNSFLEGDVPLPDILHSRWWLERHWGPAFSVRAMADDGFAEIDLEGKEYSGHQPVFSDPGFTPRAAPSHGWVLLERRDTRPRSSELEEPDWGDRREYRSLMAGCRIAQREARDTGRELSEVRAWLASVERHLAHLDQQKTQLEQQVGQLEPALAACRRELQEKQTELDLVANSRWWRLRTAIGPALRGLKGVERLVRRRSGGSAAHGDW